jgi:hypothetical protein
MGAFNYILGANPVMGDTTRKSHFDASISFFAIELDYLAQGNYVISKK